MFLFWGNIIGWSLVALGFYLKYQSAYRPAQYAFMTACGVFLAVFFYSISNVMG